MFGGVWVVDAQHVAFGLKMRNLIGNFDLCVVSIFFFADGFCFLGLSAEFHESNKQSNMSKKE